MFSAAYRSADDRAIAALDETANAASKTSAVDSLVFGRWRDLKEGRDDDGLYGRGRAAKAIGKRRLGAPVRRRGLVFNTSVTAAAQPPELFFYAPPRP